MEDSSSNTGNARNAGRPILVINEIVPQYNRIIRDELKLFGLASRVYSTVDMPAAVSSRNLSLIVSVVDSEFDTPFIQYSGAIARKSTPKIVLYRQTIVERAKRKSLSPQSLNEEVSHPYLIAHAIFEAFSKLADHASPVNNESDLDYSSSISDLIDRLDVATDAICDLRINSTTEAVSELRNVVSALKIKFVSVDSVRPVSKNDLRSIIYEVLTVISKIYDHVDNSRLAAMVVAGATTAIMGCSGLATPITAAILLASWHGKEAFIAAITKAKPLRIE